MRGFTEYYRFTEARGAKLLLCESRGAKLLLCDREVSSWERDPENGQQRVQQNSWSVPLGALARTGQMFFLNFSLCSKPSH